MFNYRTMKRLYACVSVALCLALLAGTMPTAAAPDAGTIESTAAAAADSRPVGASPDHSMRTLGSPPTPEQDRSTTSWPGDFAPPSRLASCDLYPIALPSSSLVGIPVGGTVTDILGGTQPNNFGWLTWAGAKDVSAIIAGLTLPANGHSYVNPNDPSDHLVSVGDWVHGRPGGVSGSNIRAALDRLKTIDFSVPIWDVTQVSGTNVRYHISNFAKVRLLTYSLRGQNRITVQFLGFDTACGDNLPPIAGTDVYTTDEDIPLAVSVPGVLDNDSDPNLDLLSSVIVTDTISGTVTLALDGSFIYTPTTDFNGTDFFLYRASDGELLSTTATVTITVNPLNDAPVAVDDTHTVHQGSALTVTAPGILDNDRDPDGDVLTAVLVSGPLSGTIDFGPDGSIVYTPTIGYAGTDTFTYLPNDGSLNSNVATVTITVTPSVCVPPPPDMVGWWPGDGNALNLVSANHGTPQNGAAFASGWVDEAFSLDGQDDFVEVPDDPSFTQSSITVDAWVFPSDADGIRPIISKYDQHQTSWILTIANQPSGRLRFGVFGDAEGTVARAIDTDGPVLATGVWQHVAATFDGSTQAIKIYVNGVEVPSTFVPGHMATVTSIFNSSAPALIGKTK